MTEEINKENSEEKQCPKVKKKKKKTFGHLFCGTIMCLFYFILMLCLLLLTGVGQRTAIHFVDTIMNNLKIGSVTGNLQEGLVINHFSFSNQNLNIDIEKTDLQLNFACLLDGKICLNHILVEKPNINLKKIFSKSKEKSSQNKDFKLPIELRIDLLQISKFSFNSKIIDVHLGEFKTALLTNKQQGIELLPTILNDLTIRLPENKKQDKSLQLSKEKQNPINWQALTKYLNTPIFNHKIFTSLSIPVDFNIVSLKGMNWHILQGQKNLFVKNLQLTAKANNSSIYLKKLQLESNFANLQAQGKLSTENDYPIDISLKTTIPTLTNSPLIGKSLFLQQILWQQNQVDIHISGALKEKTEFSIHSKGTIPFNLNGEANFNLAKTPLHLTLFSHRLQYPFSKESKNIYQLQNVNVDIKGNLLNYAVNINAEMKDKKLPMSSVSLYARGGLTQLDIKHSHFTIGDGQANFDGRVNWYNGIKWKTNLQLEKFQFGNYLLKSLPGTLSGDLFSYGVIREGEWEINIPNINLKGTLSHKPFLLNTSFKSSNEKLLDLKKILLNYGKNHIEGQGYLSNHSKLEFLIDAPNLNGLIPTLKAYLKGKINIEGQTFRPTVKINLEGKNLAFKDYSLKAFKIDSDIQSEGMINGKVNASLNDLQLATFNLKNVNLVVQGDEKAHSVIVHSKGKPLALNFDLKGHWDRNNQQWNGELQTIDIPSIIGKWASNKAINIIYHHQNQVTDVSPHCWENKKEGSLCFDKPIVIGKEGYALFKLKNINLSVINQFIQSNLITGLLNGKGHIQWFSNKPIEAMLNVTTKNLLLQKRMDYRTLHLKIPKFRLFTKIKNDQLNLQNFIYIEDQGHIDTNVKVNNINNLKELTGSLQIHDISLSIVKQLLSKGERVEGNVSANLKFGGDLTTPKINGELLVQNIYTKIKKMPFDITEGNVDLEFLGNHSTLEGKIVTKESNMNIYGLADWKDINNWNSEMSINAKDFYIDLPILPTIAKVKLTPDIYIKAQPHLLQLSGNIDIPWARIDIIKLPSTGIPVSPDLVILNGPNKSKPSKLISLAKSGKTNSGTIIESNLKISLGKDVSLKAYGLNTYLTGLLSLNQQKGVFGLYGQVDLERGSYKSFGQDLLIQNGNIIFSGLPSKPALNIKAIRNPSAMENKDITAGILVTGNADNPKIHVFSNPAMSQDQAFSYLLTGHSLENNGDTSSSSSIGTALLAMSLAQSGKVVGNIGKIFGISNLNLSTAGMGESSKVEVSGNLTQNLQVKYGIGLFDGLAELTLRYRLLPRLYLQTVSSVNQAVDLLYQFEI